MNIINVSFIAFAALVSLATLSPAASAQTDSVPPFAPPGKLVDVGGWRMHINCTGTAKSGEPTVVLEAGAGDFSVEWSLVQPSVAKFARVCSYDRSDDGWSDWGPHPRTLHQDVYELHTLLEKSGEHGPLVLVGHSYGAWITRLYASTYRADVAGIVLIEGGLDNPVRMLPNGKLVHNADLVTGKTIPPVKTSNPLRVTDIPPAALAAMKDAAVQMTPHANEPPRDKLPANAQRMRLWATAQIKHYGPSDNPFEPEELAGLAAERAANPHPFGDLPLVVITRGVIEDSGPDNNAEMEAARKRDFAGVAALSTKGKLVVAEHSGHHVHLEQPDLVIATIREVVSAANR
jgi:pimeloyl-ACP methyl ester carboxylesterase